LGIALLIGIVVIYSSEPFIKPVFNLQGFKSLIRYGFNNEFNYFLQFLNYRLSYYFIVLLFGYRSLGIFSIVISISEAVWIVSQSLSAVHFSNVINSTDQLSNRKETNQFARQSFLVSILLLAIAVVTPATVYQLVFGNEFGSVSRYILYLVPGVVSIAVSNIYGHYFAGVGRLNILRNKSLLGLAASIILMPILVRKYDLTGACISLNISYFASSLYLWIMFRKEMGIVHTATNPKGSEG
jgi:O-antigen/teichoic acid export membrane protein